MDPAPNSLVVNLDGIIRISEAKLSFNKKGEEITSNDKVRRIHLDIFGRNENIFDITCYAKPNPTRETFLALIGGKKVYVDLDEFGDRLHISKSKIIHHISQGTFKDFYQKKRKKLRTLKEINSHFSKVIVHYKPDENHSILHPIKNPTLEIKREGLMKIIKLFHIHLSYRLVQEPKFIKLHEKTKTKYSLLQFKTLLAFSEPEKQLNFLIDYSSKELINKGTTGFVYKAFNFYDGDFLAIKKSNRTNSDSDFDMMNEIKNLKQLEKLNLKPGIQNKIYFASSHSTHSSQYYACPYYENGDLFDFIKNEKDIISRLSKLELGIHEIVEGLYQLHKNGFAHTDIKPENILLKIDSELQIHLEICDMGGLKSHTENTHSIHLHTPCMSPFAPFGYVFTINELKAYDVYQLGATIVSIVIDYPPYVLRSEKSNYSYPDFKLPFPEDELLTAFSKKAVDLLKLMCHPKESERITIDEVLRTIKNEDFRWNK